MRSELTVTVLLNSSVEDVLGWKCCNLQGMNLEVQVSNRGREEVVVLSAMEFRDREAGERVDYFYPAGTHPLGPQEGQSFYCSYDADRFRRFTHVIVTDRAGRRHRAAITGRDEPAALVE